MTATKYNRAQMLDKMALLAQYCNENTHYFADLPPDHDGVQWEEDDRAVIELLEACITDGSIYSGDLMDCNTVWARLHGEGKIP